MVTCVFVVGGGLGLLRGAALLEEEGGSFDHEEALTEAGNDNKRVNTSRSPACPSSNN